LIFQIERLDRNLDPPRYRSIHAHRPTFTSALAPCNPDRNDAVYSTVRRFGLRTPLFAPPIAKVAGGSTMWGRKYDAIAEFFGNCIVYASVCSLNATMWEAAVQRATFNAASTSSTRSSVSSRPSDIRSRPSEIPSSALASSVRFLCVVVAGWVIRLFASPRLLE